MLRIAEQWHASDLGRQRQGNEDNYYVRAPLFVVADGMGGAQAGEVASEMAVASFDGGLPGGSPAEALVDVIEDANRRIHERSRSEQQRAGMGTTVTAAYVDEGEVTIAHVGDSRAYLWRDSDLIRLTRDHSLVGELVARGKLTEAQAETHPQRSVITRALGPEPSVQVDVEVLGARDGDVFLLCSDGLTSMVHEPRIKPILESAAGLEQAGRELIAAANEAGGRDNITVILFRLEKVAGGDDAAAAEADGETTEYDTFEGAAVPAPRQGVSRPQAEAPTRAGDDAEADYRASGTVALSALSPEAAARERAAAEAVEEAPKRTAPLPDHARPAPPERPRRRSRRRRIAARAIIALIVLGVVLAGAWIATRAVFFIGTDPDRGNTVTIYRGLPIELPFGAHLYQRYAGSGVTLESIPPARRNTFTDHQLRSHDNAEDLVIQLERGQLDS